MSVAPSYLFNDILTKPVQIQEIVNYLDKLQFSGTPVEHNKDTPQSTRVQTYKKLVDEKGKAGSVQILQHLVGEQDLVLEKGNKAEIESFYAIFATLDLKGMNKELITKITEHLTKDHQNKKVERLATLGHLYNLFPDPNLRFHLLLNILEYSAVSDQTSAVLGVFENIDNRLKELGVSLNQKRRVYELILKHFEDDWTNPTALDFCIKYFSSFDAKESVSAPIQNQAKQLIISLFKQTDPSTLEADYIAKMNELLETHVINSLKAHKLAEIQTFYGLLELFVTKGYIEFVQFYKKHQKLLDQHGLNYNDLVQKIRLLSLNSLAAEKSVISFDEIAKFIDIPEADVEFFVVEAITEGVVDARIDQVNNRVIVRHAEARVFNKESWVKLDDKLLKWKSNLQNLLSVVQTVKQQREKE